MRAIDLERSTKIHGGDATPCTELRRTLRRGGASRGIARAFGALLVSVAVLWVESNAVATTFAKLSLGQLVAAAPLIVRARCQGSIVVPGPGEIRTITSFEVRETWKGRAPEIVRVRLLGGRTATLTSHVEGVPRFRAGEDVVLFLQPARGGAYTVTSWAQGTFRIRRAGPGAALLVTQDTAAFSPSAFAGSVAGKGTGSGAIRNMPLDEFRRRVMSSAGVPAGI